MVCTARIGEASNPLIPDGGADIVLSFELLETLRAMCKANENTAIIASTETMVPLSVSTQKTRYPSLEEVRKGVEAVSETSVFIDSRRIAEEEGVPISSNVVMVGALAGAGKTGIAPHHFEKAVETSIRRNVAENHRAFKRGFEEGKAISA